jgi:hypothetical protein
MMLETFVPPSMLSWFGIVKNSVMDRLDRDAGSGSNFHFNADPDPAFPESLSSSK